MSVTLVPADVQMNTEHVRLKKQKTTRKRVEQNLADAVDETNCFAVGAALKNEKQAVSACHRQVER